MKEVMLLYSDSQSDSFLDCGGGGDDDSDGDHGISIDARPNCLRRW